MFTVCHDAMHVRHLGTGMYIDSCDKYQVPFTPSVMRQAGVVGLAQPRAFVLSTDNPRSVKTMQKKRRKWMEAVRSAEVARKLARLRLCA